MKKMHNQYLEKSHNYSYLTKILLDMLSIISHGSLKVITPDGKHYNFSGTKPGEDISVSINDWRFCDELLLKGDIGLGESYVLGYWDCDNINKLVKWGIENKKPLERAIKGSFTKILFYRFKHFLKRNSKRGSIKNVHTHYDIGNKFYQLWLDSTMTYSSAIFKSSNEELSDAQENKYKNILNKLKPEAGDHILDVGCGWGGFMEYAVRNGFKVTGITISKEQYEYAKRRLSKYGSFAEVKLMDYRDIAGKYNHIVSIEMFEALGFQYWKKYFNVLYSILRPGGKLVIQSITINNDDFLSYKNCSDFIQQYIFPGGMLPSAKIVKDIATKQGFLHNDNFEFGLDYGATLKKWEENFTNALDKIKMLGFDERFIRTWRFYLKYCQGGFESRKLSVSQFNFIK